MGIQSSDDCEPEERDYFANCRKTERWSYETENSGDIPTVLHNLEEAMRELERNRFAQVLIMLIEREKFQ